MKPKPLIMFMNMLFQQTVIPRPEGGRLPGGRGIPAAKPRDRPQPRRMKTATVSEDFAKKFATEKETPYTRWVRDEGLDIISSFYVPDLHTVELKPWARRGGRGVYINHDASRTSNDCYVCEIPPGKSLAPQRQLFEEMIYVLDGRGSTTVWNDAGKRIQLRVEGGRDLRHPAQHLAPALQRLGRRAPRASSP